MGPSRVSALSSRGLCVLYRLLLDPELEPTEATAIELVTGSISFNGRPYRFLSDIEPQVISSLESDSRHLGYSSQRIELLVEETPDQRTLGASYRVTCEDSKTIQVGVQNAIASIDRIVRIRTAAFEPCADLVVPDLWGKFWKIHTPLGAFGRNITDLGNCVVSWKTRTSTWGKPVFGVVEVGLYYAPMSYLFLYKHIEDVVFRERISLYDGAVLTSRIHCTMCAIRLACQRLEAASLTPKGGELQVELTTYKGTGSKFTMEFELRPEQPE